jgi:hypothetical protein
MTLATMPGVDIPSEDNDEADDWVSNRSQASEKSMKEHKN